MAPKGRRYNITSLARSVSRHLGFARRRAHRSPAMTITISAGIAGNLSSRARPRAISRWLLAIAALVFLMVVIGGDRTSVVSGKSVSVRVALGGRRLIKTKKHQTDLPSRRDCNPNTHPHY